MDASPALSLPSTTETASSRHAQPPPRRTQLLDSRFSLWLGWISVIVGGVLAWSNPIPKGPFSTVDLALSPIVALLLYVVVKRWCDDRGAVAAVIMYLSLLGVTHVTLAWPGGIAERNFSCAGSAQLLVGLGSLCLLEHLALPLWLWCAVAVVASAFQPQFTFVPLLMMTLLRSRTVLVIGFIDKARAVALRCALICLVVLVAKRSLGLPIPVRVDSVTLPLAWWTASWLLDGEALMPYFARVLISGILCVATVQNFRAWPAMGVLLLVAFTFSKRDPRSADPDVRAPRNLPGSPLEEAC